MTGPSRADAREGVDWAMFEPQAKALLDEASIHLEVLHARPARHDRARVDAQLWFNLTHAWSLLTGAKLSGPPTLH